MKEKNIQASRKKGTIALLITSYASIALIVVKNIVMVPLYLSYIDNRLYGAWLATGSIIAYFGLLDFGLNGVLIQRIASNYGKKNFERLGNILGIGLIISFALSCIPMLIGFSLSSWVPGIVHIDGVEAQQLSRCREPECTKIYKNELSEGMKVVDIGANIGYYVLMETHKIGSSGKIYAVEPSPENFNMLKANIELNKPSTPIKLHNLAIAG